ncbi:hypothetical protein HMPREF1624_07481 [Sporothrix schenckii ATCC 58251]|uniref:Alpha-1,3-mannosyltransferase n=1 Tax=Sporothrix schenckii (strain ATCC 58251 / de Perez 2211183) TaxID=1391915 RepID=U7PM10_SPOS1|nr:hypothetical protein HMPREF1624_07481 [Sporothrix schenckii ATCC 58251]
MPPPHLHPRSRMTSSLFATTVFASFFVVVLPHVLPCPAPRVALADGQMAEVAADGTVVPQQRRRRRRRMQDEVMETAAPVPVQVERDADGMARFAMESGQRVTGQRVTSDSEAFPSPSPRRTTRACPVPKPGGIVGELLGFTSGNASQQPQQQQQQQQQQHLLQSQRQTQRQSLPHQPSLEK